MVVSIRRPNSHHHSRKRRYRFEKEMTMKSQDIDQMKDAMRAPWIAGNFGAMAKTIGVPEAEGFVARLALEPDVRVLDIAAAFGMDVTRCRRVGLKLSPQPQDLPKMLARSAGPRADVPYVSLRSTTRSSSV
jgi:hypothetical protein